MLLSESYKNRLQELAGIKVYKPVLTEADLYDNMKNRVKFSIDLMQQAIEEGREVGLVFQTKNEKYEMPVWKARIIQPVAMGYNSKGNLVIRAVHVIGQSEKEARKQGLRSAEASNQWRLLKASNIKSMFFTGRFFDRVSLPGFKAKDSAMTSVIASFDANKAKAFQKAQKAAPEQKPATTTPAPAPTTPSVARPGGTIKPTGTIPTKPASIPPKAA